MNKIKLEENFGKLTATMQDTAHTIKHLAEHDALTDESIETAIDYIYKIIDLNSELLSKLQKTQRNKDAFNELHDEIEEYHVTRQGIQDKIGALTDI